MFNIMALNVRWALTWSNAEKQRLAKCFMVDGEPMKTVEEVNTFLLDRLAEGNEIILGTSSEHGWAHFSKEYLAKKIEDDKQRIKRLADARRSQNEC